MTCRSLLLKCRDAWEDQEKPFLLSMDDLPFQHLQRLFCILYMGGKALGMT